MDEKLIVPQKSPEEKAADEFNELIAKRLGKFKSQASLISQNVSKEAALAEQIDRLKAENLS